MFEFSHLLVLAIMSSVFSSTLPRPSWVQTPGYVALPGAPLSGSIFGSNYTMGTAFWIGQITPGGINTTIMGPTFQAIFDHLVYTNPELRVQNNTEMVKRAPGFQEVSVLENERKDCQMSHPYPCDIWCNRPNFKNYNNYKAWAEAYNYLISRNPADGFCGVVGGTGKCARLACSWDSGVFMCNDGTRGQDLQYMYCSEVADYGVDLVDICTTETSWNHPMVHYFNGQRYRKDLEYSVLMAQSDSHC